MSRDADRLHAVVDDAVALLGNTPDALLPLLHTVQQRIGFIPAESVPRIAAALNLSRAQVHGVVTFYHDFRTTPGAAHRLRLCRAEACQAVGARDLEAHLRERFGLLPGEPHGASAVSIEAVYCFGNCAAGPSLEIDGVLHGRVTPDRCETLLGQW
ncbi:MAG: NAD(P)H-dependent oxidoreductase subunit E [Pseudomonadota bacterium]|nr:NAD(P)H-dependent oxidoreductase subunit E [Pseudomonadota bacterium]